MFDLSDKNALVTGSSRGIGVGIATVLAKLGANVAVNYNSNAESAEEVVGKIKEMGRESFAVKADVSDKGQVVGMFKRVKEEWEKLDILVNNAGIIKYGNFEDITEDEWNKIINVNLKGQFMCSQEAVKLMKVAGWGRIVNIASISSGGVGIGFKNISHYTASKGGVVALTENMAIELAGYGINVNAVAPGAIESDMSAGMENNEEMMKATLAQIPKGRIGKPEDIGAAVGFLASEEADYITGVVLYVDGGWLAG